MTTTLRRRLTRWTACAMAAAACLLGTVLPAHARNDPFPAPTDAPTQTPTPGILPGHAIIMRAGVQYGLFDVPTRGFHDVFKLHLAFGSLSRGERITLEECQDLAQTFWSGSGEDYYAEAEYSTGSCYLDAYYIGEARHSFYSLDEAGHLQVRAPMSYLNQIAASFEQAEFSEFSISFKNINNAKCNAEPSRASVDTPIIDIHGTQCEWKTEHGATIPTTDAPLIEGTLEQPFIDDDQGTVGPFTDPVAPINPYTITPTPQAQPTNTTTQPEATPTSSKGHRGPLIAIGAAITVMTIIAATALAWSRRRTH